MLFSEHIQKTYQKDKKKDIFIIKKSGKSNPLFAWEKEYGEKENLTDILNAPNAKPICMYRKVKEKLL